MAQFVRNSCMPFAGSPSAGSTASASGIAGPGPRVATQAAIFPISSSSNWAGFTGACAELLAMGIRPVLTWKWTEAAPTPTREGPMSVPWPCVPWQVAQFAWKRRWPSSMSEADAVSASAAGPIRAYRPPVRMSASSTRTAGAYR